MTVQFHPNARAALAFSAKRDVMSRPAAQSQPVAFAGSGTANPLPNIPHYKPLVKFGALPLYDGPFNTLRLITDFQDQTSNARIRQRFASVLTYVQRARQQNRILPNFEFDRSAKWRHNEPGTLDHDSVSDIPLRNIDSASQAVFELARDPNQDLFIHVTDPGVGSGQKAHERSILVTDHHGVHIGPNNGTLGLLTQFLDTLNEPYELLEIDLDKVAELENLRTGISAGSIGSTFHGRDVFGVVAGAIAGGLDPRSLATPASRARNLEPVVTPYGRSVSFPAVGVVETVRVNRDNTSGNLVLNVPVNHLDARALREEGAVFRLRNPRTGHTLELPFKRTFADVPKGSPLLYLGSKGTPQPGHQYVEAALNAGDVAEALGIDPKAETATALELTRIH